MTEKNNRITKRIIIFSPHYPPYVGGLENHAEEFNKLISNEGFDITVFTTRIPVDSSESEIINENLRIIRFPAIDIIPNYSFPRFWNIKFWKLFLNLFKNDYDIVISRLRFANTSLLAFILSKTKKIRWIHIEHSSDFIKLTSKLKSLIAKVYDYTVGSLIFKSSNLNISISKAVQKFIYRFDSRYSPVIYRGLELEELNRIKPNHKTKNKYKDKIIILTAARLYKWKGIENSISAIKNLPEEIKSKIIFLIIGDGEDFSELKSKINGEPIKMMGRMKREEVISTMKVADIYIHSSLPGGGLSTSLLEAMYSGCSIIATTNEGADEIIVNGVNGILVDYPYEKNIMSSILYLVINNKERIRFRNKSTSTITRNWNWNKSLKYYKEIINA